jgi:glucose/mannose-6-phosphate isomerase
MNNLTDLDAIKQLDPQNTLGSTEKIVDQLEAAWQQVNALPIPKAENIQNIVFCGMGASIYGALVTKALASRELTYPTEIVSDYHLPEWVNEHTLVVLTSYSGTTEEVLSCAEEALAENTKILVLTQGGPLAEWAKQHAIPAYIFDGQLNPAGVPRLGNGYTILGLMGLLNKAGIINIEEHEVTNAITRLREKFEEIREQAIQDVERFVSKIPIIIAAEHLAGNAQILRNQFNETSKTFSAFYLVPDLNHHLMEGLQFPQLGNMHFIVLHSQNYSEKNRKRMELTIDVIKQNKREVHQFTTSGQTVYDDFLETLVYGSFLTFYLAIRHDQNPATNPWVDWFKNELKK